MRNNSPLPSLAGSGVLSQVESGTERSEDTNWAEPSWASSQAGPNKSRSLSVSQAKSQVKPSPIPNSVPSQPRAGPEQSRAEPRTTTRLSVSKR